ncbi:hypothetical protein Ssi03_12400 [Sphaerisporangium siamense]|nr:hypothetical protein Ssi03_12400 [Sphaerisporangium siamense]
MSRAGVPNHAATATATASPHRAGGHPRDGRGPGLAAPGGTAGFAGAVSRTISDRLPEPGDDGVLSMRQFWSAGAREGRSEYAPGRLVAGSLPVRVNAAENVRSPAARPAEKRRARRYGGIREHLW